MPTETYKVTSYTPLPPPPGNPTEVELLVTVVSATTTVNCITAKKSSSQPTRTGKDYPDQHYAKVYLGTSDFEELLDDLEDTATCNVTYNSTSISTNPKVESVTNFNSYLTYP